MHSVVQHCHASNTTECRSASANNTSEYIAIHQSAHASNTWESSICLPLSDVQIDRRLREYKVLSTSLFNICTLQCCSGQYPRNVLSKVCIIQTGPTLVPYSCLQSSTPGLVQTWQCKGNCKLLQSGVAGPVLHNNSRRQVDWPHVWNQSQIVCFIVIFILVSNLTGCTCCTHHRTNVAGQVSRSLITSSPPDNSMKTFWPTFFSSVQQGEVI